MFGEKITQNPPLGLDSQILVIDNSSNLKKNEHKLSKYKYSNKTHKNDEKN